MNSYNRFLENKKQLDKNYYKQAIKNLLFVNNKRDENTLFEM